MKVSPRAARKKKTKHTEISSDEQDNNEIKIEMDSPTTSVIRNTKLEHMEIEIQTPTIDGQHFIIDDNITVESNIEIEFITSDELMPNEMEADYENSDKKYENDFGEEMSSQHDDDDDGDDYDGGNESWDNVRLMCSLVDKMKIILLLRRRHMLNQMKLNIK